MKKPETAKEIILSLPFRFRKEKCEEAGYATTIHFDIRGEDGGVFTCVVNNDTCEVFEEIIGEAKCKVQADAGNYADIEWGRSNAQMALMMGKIKVSNVMELMTFIGMFRSLERAFGA